MLVRRHISSPINRISGLGVQYGIVEPSSSWRKIWSCLAPVTSGWLWFIWVALAFLCSTGMASLPVLSLVPCSVCGSFEIHESREESGNCSNNKIRTKREITATHHACIASLWHKYRVWIRQFSQIFGHIVHLHNKIWYIFKNHKCSTTILCYSTFLQQIFTMIQFVHYEHHKFIQNEK